MPLLRMEAASANLNPDHVLRHAYEERDVYPRTPIAVVWTTLAAQNLLKYQHRQLVRSSCGSVLDSRQQNRE